MKQKMMGHSYMSCLQQDKVPHSLAALPLHRPRANRDLRQAAST